MPEEIIDPETLEEPEIAEATTDYSEQSAKLQDDFKDYASGERTEAAEAQIKAQKAATEQAAIDGLHQVFEVNKAPIDLDAVKNFADSIDATSPSSISDPNTLASLKSAEESLPPATRNGLISFAKACYTKVKSLFDKAPAEAKDFQTAADAVKAEIDNPTSAENLENRITALEEKNKILEDKLETINGNSIKAKGIDYKFWVKTAIFLFLVASGMYLFFSLKNQANAMSGCYMLFTDVNSNNLKIKLTGCDDYYAANPAYCVCGTKIPPVMPTVAVTAGLCSSTLSSECQYPYCLGFCGGSAACNNFPGGKPLQCTSGGDPSIPGFVSYTYVSVSVLDLFMQGVKTAAQAAGEAAGDIISGILNGLLGSLPPFVWIIIGVVVVAIIAFFVLRK